MNYINKLYWFLNFLAKAIFFIAIAKYLNTSEFIDFNIITAYSDQILLLVSCSTQIYFIKNKKNDANLIGNALVGETLLLILYFNIFLIVSKLSALNNNGLILVILLSAAKVYIQIIHRYSICYISFESSIKNTLVCETFPILISITSLLFFTDLTSIILIYAFSSIAILYLYTKKRININIGINRDFIAHYFKYVVYSVLILSSRNIEKILVLEKYRLDMSIVNYVFYTKIIAMILMIGCGFIDAKFFTLINKVKSAKLIKDELRLSIAKILVIGLVASLSVTMLPMLPMLNIKSLESSDPDIFLFLLILLTIIIQQIYFLLVHVYEIFFNKKLLYIRVIILYVFLIFNLMISEKIYIYVISSIITTLALLLIDYSIIRRKL